jgi:hypothetical protein
LPRRGPSASQGLLRTIEISISVAAINGYFYSMRMGLRLAALGVAVVTLALWFFGGPNFGWTKTRVAVPIKDEVTGLDGVQWENHFLPGVDFAGGGIAVAGALWAASFAFTKRASAA